MTDDTEIPTGVRPPRQDRSRASLERVLKSGAEILRSIGYAGFTVSEVARRSGTSTGLIYARFENKNALFEAVMVRELSRMVEEENLALKALASQHPSTADLIEGVVHVLASTAKREAALTQVFMKRTVVEPTLAEHVKRLRTAPLIVSQLLVDRRRDLPHEDPGRAADMAFWIANSALERRVHTAMWRHWQPQSDNVSWSVFVSDLVSALQAFLLTAPR